MEKIMVNDQRVKVLLHGDEQWYNGTVTKARKMWITIDEEENPWGICADEHNIRDWEPLD